MAVVQNKKLQIKVINIRKNVNTTIAINENTKDINFSFRKTVHLMRMTKWMIH